MIAAHPYLNLFTRLDDKRRAGGEIWLQDLSGSKPNVRDMPKRDTEKLLASHCETRNHNTILTKENNTKKKKKMGNEGKKKQEKKTWFAINPRKQWTITICLNKR